MAEFQPGSGSYSIHRIHMSSSISYNLTWPSRHPHLDIPIGIHTTARGREMNSISWEFPLWQQRKKSSVRDFSLWKSVFSNNWKWIFFCMCAAIAVGYIVDEKPSIKAKGCHSVEDYRLKQFTSLLKESELFIALTFPRRVHCCFSFPPNCESFNCPFSLLRETVQLQFVSTVKV